MNSPEMRMFKRVPFSSSEKIDAICKHKDGEDNPIRLHIANISEGGLGLMAKKNAIGPIQQNDIILLDKVVGHEALEFMTDLELEVKWILDSDLMENLGFGCSFCNIPGALRDRIISFMNTMDHYKLQA